MSRDMFAAWEVGFRATSSRTTESLPDVRQGNEEEEVHGSPGGYGDLQEEEILQPPMCEHEGRRGQAGLALEGTPTAENGMRSVRMDEAVTGTPSGREYQEYQSSEHPDALYSLPQVSPRYGKAAWKDGSWEHGIPRIAKNISHRVDRLAAIGDGQVPAVVREAWRRLKERRTP